VQARGPDWIDDLRLRVFRNLCRSHVAGTTWGPNVPDGGNERAIMKYTLTVGLLICMPTVALLAAAGVAVLAGNLRQRLGREAEHRQRERDMADAYVSGLRFASGHDRDQLHDESLPCRLTADAVSLTA
jgi:hypothetical protein